MNTSTQPPTKVKSPAGTHGIGGATSPPAKETKAKEPKPPKDPNAPKAPRGPRKDYGYSEQATIKMTDGTPTYRGQRLEWYNLLKEHAGKTVESFLKASEAKKDPGRGWLRFFVQDEACTLTPPPVDPSKPAAPTPPQANNKPT